MGRVWLSVNLLGAMSGHRAQGAMGGMPLLRLPPLKGFGAARILHHGWCGSEADNWRPMRDGKRRWHGRCFLRVCGMRDALVAARTMIAAGLDRAERATAARSGRVRINRRPQLASQGGAHQEWRRSWT